MITSLSVFLSAFMVTNLILPWIIHKSHQSGRLVPPRHDRWHRTSTPGFGGVGIFVGFFAGCITYFLLSDYKRGFIGQEIFELLPLVVGCFIIFLLGLIDDLRQLTPAVKIVGQFIGASIVIFAGYRTQFFTPRLSDALIAEILNVLATYLWLISITNAMNLIDNMDGLAGGIALITSSVLCYMFWLSSDWKYFGLTLALAGSILAFLRLNFPPARIFMGDGGSLFIGFILAVLAIAKKPQASNVFAIIGVPTLLFLVPILDTILVTFTRLLRGYSPMLGGKDHTSHRLIAFGLSERQTLFVFYVIASLSGILVLAVETIGYWLGLIVLPLILIALSLITAYLAGIKVVTQEYTPSISSNFIARVAFSLAYQRRVLEFILDLIVIGVAYYFAYLFHYGYFLANSFLQNFISTLPIVLVITFLSFLAWGAYRGMWRYIGVIDFVRYLFAATTSIIVIMEVMIIFYPANAFDPILYVLFGVFVYLGFSLTRSSFKTLDYVSNKLRSIYKKNRFHADDRELKKSRVVIYKAGAASDFILKWLQYNPDSGYDVVGIIDDDIGLIGRQIRGVGVVGGLDQLERLLQENSIDGILMADYENIGGVVEICRKHGCWLRRLRLEFEQI